MRNTGYSSTVYYSLQSTGNRYPGHPVLGAVCSVQSSEYRPVLPVVECGVRSKKVTFSLIATPMLLEVTQKSNRNPLHNIC
jgi:hypothetical protein